MQIQGLPPVRPGAEVPSGRPTQTLRPGDTLRGEVVSVEEGTVNIRLSDGNTMRAQVAPGVDLAPGEEVRLTVSGDGDQPIIMRLTRGEEGVQAELSTGERGAVRQNDTGARLYQLLRQMGLPATRENYQRAQEIMQRFPEIDQKTAAFLAANVKTLPPEGQDASLRALVDALKPGTTGIAAPVEDLMRALEAETVARMTTPELPGAAATAGGADIAKILLGLPEAQDQTATQALTRFLQSAAPEGHRLLVAEGRVPDAAALLRTVAQMPPEQAAQLIAAFAATLPEQAQGRLTGALQRAAQALSQAVAQAAPEGRPTPEALGNFTQTLTLADATAAPGATQAAPGTPAQQAATAAGGADPALPQQPAAQAPGQAAQPGQAPQGAQPGQAAPGQPAPATPLPPTAQAPQAPAQPPQAAPAPPQTAAPVAQLPQAVQLAPETVAAARAQAPEALLLRAESFFARLDGDNPAAELRRVATTLLQNLGDMRQVLEIAPGREAAVFAAQADARAQALPQIAQFTYLQLPVEYRDRRETADLYVMQRPGRRGGESDEFTVLLALETQNLGRVETILRARERDVSLTFRMKEGEAAQAIQGGFDGLRESIEGIGYLLRETIFARLDQPVTPQTFGEVLSSVREQTMLDVII